MKGYLNDIKQSVEYALSDIRAILVIGSILFANSLIVRYFDPGHILKSFNVFVLIVIGYGSYITWYTINDYDGLPNIGNIKKLMWE